MDSKKFESWKAVTENSKYRWQEDHVTKLNGKGALYYTGGEEGYYMRLYPDGKLSVGRYEDAYPHIGEAFFTQMATHRYASFEEGFKAVWELGGRQFVVDLFTASPGFDMTSM